MSSAAILSFLFMLGACFVCFFFFAFLDQLIYGLGITNSGIATWQKYIIEVFHVFSSLVVAFVCPVGFIIGAIGSIRVFTGRSKAMAIKNT